SEIDRIVARVPIATHNQRARGTLIVGSPGNEDVPAHDLIAIVEDGMSSEIYELLKRPDELYVVDKAHRRPRFVEDSVREMVAGVIAGFPGLPDDSFVSAHQENYETIHTHDVEAERHGLLGEMRTEVAGGDHAARHITLAEWLDGPT
ncbi:MAG: GTP cyclohydrolase, FolE2/MptA family, partial [Thermoleophilia bacterium]